MTATAFGAYGGRYVPETLIPALDELTSAWESLRSDPGFHAELDALLANYAGRPTPLTRAARFAPDARVYLKREDLLHTGAHKINNALGQAVVARRLGKRRIIAETGAGQHGVATATVCAHFGLDCIVYMGSEDMRRQAPNVERMRLLGAEVRPVEFGTRTLKEATSEAIRDWIANVETTLLPDRLVRRSRSLPRAGAGAAARDRARSARADPERRGSAAGRRDRLRRRRLERDRHVHGLRRGRVRAADRRRSCGRRVARRTDAPGCCTAHARRCSQTTTARSSTPTRSPPGSTIPASARSTHFCATPAERSTSRAPTTRQLAAFHRLCRTEGIVPALESSHALARALDCDAELIVVCLSGRGDKDLAEVLAR